MWTEDACSGHSRCVTNSPKLRVRRVTLLHARMEWSVIQTGTVEIADCCSAVSGALADVIRQVSGGDPRHGGTGIIGKLLHSHASFWAEMTGRLSSTWGSTREPTHGVFK